MDCSVIFYFFVFFLATILILSDKTLCYTTSTPLIAHPIKAIIFAETFHRGGYVLSLFFKLPPESEKTREVFQQMQNLFCYLGTNKQQ